MNENSERKERYRTFIVFNRNIVAFQEQKNSSLYVLNFEPLKLNT